MQQLAKERKQRLDESKKRHELNREINELESWINDKVLSHGLLKFSSKSPVFRKLW